MGRNRRAGEAVRANRSGQMLPEVFPVRSKYRGLRRLLETTPSPRTGGGSALALMFIVSGWFYGATVSGTAPSLLSGAAVSVGLKTTGIVLTGQVETSEQDIFQALELGSRTSLLGFDAAAARERIMKLSWAKDVAVRKLYPGKLTVALVEKRAVAVWQNNGSVNCCRKNRGHNCQVWNCRLDQQQILPIYLIWWVTVRLNLLAIFCRWSRIIPLSPDRLRPMSELLIDGGILNWRMESASNCPNLTPKIA